MSLYTELFALGEEVARLLRRRAPPLRRLRRIRERVRQIRERLGEGGKDGEG